MTFLELQRKIIQTRKARNGTHNRRDYFADDVNEEFYLMLYRKALSAANSVVKQYMSTGRICAKDKIKVDIKQ